MAANDASKRRTRSKVALLFATLAVLAVLVAPVRGQNVNGAIQIEVKDPSGAAMKATGTLEGIGNSVKRTFETDVQGAYTIKNLPYGRYRLDMSKEGFTPQTEFVDLQSGTPVSLTMTMALTPQATRVDVVAPTPLPGTDLPIEQIPAPVQTATAKDLDESGALDLSDLMNRRLSGVYVNENQENPFQPDVNYRGYTASPLLGTPQGLSVYLDGVRQNQPFGDIVAWDLIPKIAISEMALMPGSNPLFGLNTLGGAISIETKDGFSEPGTSVEFSGGSFGRRDFEIEHGGSMSNGFNWYVAGNLFHEDGWRVASPSDVRQGFAKIGWQRENTSVFLSANYADNDLHGNGLQDFRTLRRDYSSVYSIPDITKNRSPFFNLSGRHNLTSSVTLSGNAYFRYLRSDTNNGDINSDSFDQSLYNLSAADIAALRAAGYSGFPTTGNATTEPFPFWRCIAQGLEMDEPSEKCTGINTQTATKQNDYGLSGQASWHVSRNTLTGGVAWDRSTIAYRQESQFGYLNTDSISLTLIDSFADGSTSQDGVPVDTRVNLHGLINTYSLYATDTLSLGKSLTFTVSGRYNHTSINNTDLLPSDPGVRGSLNGQYVFDRFNPAVGGTYRLARWASAYASYTEASRAPTAIELGCADPNEPCNLPNALVSDPPLKQVVAKTVEVGVRNAGEGHLRWDVDYFRSENHNDLLFVASEQTGFGYFTNFGETRREGVELSLGAQFHKLTVGGSYTFLNATYQSSQILGGGSNSTNDGDLGLDGNISVQPGDHVPQVPQHMFKAYADYQPLPKLSIDLDLLAVGSSYARGNENNQDQPDEIYYLGPGTSPAYAVVNLGAHYQVQRHVQVFVQIDNLFNYHYFTAAQLGPSPYDNSGHFVARPFPPVNGDFPIRTTTFYAPGSPIGAWAGIRFRF